MIIVLSSCSKKEDELTKNNAKTKLSSFVEGAQSEEFGDESSLHLDKYLKGDKTAGEQIKWMDGDKTLYLDPKFIELHPEPQIAYGKNIYNFKSALTQVNGMWITVYFCEGSGTTCGIVYNQYNDGSMERIGVYYVAPQ